MQSSSATPKTKPLTLQYDEEYLAMKTADLRQRLDSLVRANASLQVEIDEIKKNLDLISSEPAMRGRFNLYQLAFRQYLRICEPAELLGAFIGLRARTYRLDRPNKELWSQQKLDTIESQLANSSITPQVRLEIDWLARAIDECGFRFTRDNDLKSELDRSALGWTVAVFVLLLIALGIFAFAHVDSNSQLVKIPILLFGISGGLLSATLQQRKERMYRHEMSTTKVKLLFRAVFGAIAAIIVNMFLDLRVIDFPVLRAGRPDIGSFPLSALYIVAFVSGFSERLFFGAMEKMSPKQEKK